MFARWVEESAKIGQSGLDGGITVLDYELPEVAKVVVEKKTMEGAPQTYFAVTVIVYGQFLNTSYFESLEDATEHTDATRLLVQTAFRPAT